MERDTWRRFRHCHLRNGITYFASQIGDTGQVRIVQLGPQLRLPTRRAAVHISLAWLAKHVPCIFRHYHLRNRCGVQRNIDPLNSDFVDDLCFQNF